MEAWPRPRRARRQQQQQPFSTSYYVGYVEDEESVAMIEKKFETMEQLLQGKESASGTSGTAGAEDTTGASASAEEHGEADTTHDEGTFQTGDLERLFVMTSYLSLEDHDSDRTWADYEYGVDRLSASSSSSSDEESIESMPAKRRVTSSNSTASKRRRTKEAIRSRRQRRLATSPTQSELPEVSRLPDLSRKNPFKVAQPYQSTPTAYENCISMSVDILSFDVGMLAPPGGFLVMLLDVPWHYTSIEDVARLNLCSFIAPGGYLFCWIEKQCISEVLKEFESCGMQYVESIVWVQLLANNRIVRRPSKFFDRSKLSVLIFRRPAPQISERLLLRHQRRPDVVFDFMPHVSSLSKKPDAVYETIETMLPRAGEYVGEDKFNLIHLWAPPGSKRSNWATISQMEE